MNKHKVASILLFALTLQCGMVQASFAQDRLPVREYTNPDEIVTFDRSTPFTRALDVINEFSQEHTGKIILDRTGTESGIGISIPPMHWRDALDLMLRVKGLLLVEQQDFYEIIRPQTEEGEATPGGGGQPGSGQEIVATTDSREVRINAIFFEGNRRALQEIGVDWSTLSENVPENLSDFVGSQQGGGGGDEGQLPATTGFDDQFVSVNTKGAQSVSQSVFNALINFGEIGNSGIEVQALLSAFEADNLGEVLASPTVKVMDRQQGRIQVGQDFSIKQRDFAGNVTDQFFSTGTILEVTPTVIEQNDTTFIHLEILAEKSSAQPDPVSTIVNKQQATTQALLIDGEATALAGLYSSEASEVRRGIPILKDLPGWFFGLRYLFGYNSTDYAMRELVILIQAEIEPSIPERFGKDQKNKFELLREERQQIRDELRQREEYSPTRRLDDWEEKNLLKGKISESQEQDSASMEEEQEMAEQEETENEKPAASGNNNEEPEETAEEQVVDPELNNKPVPLNLGQEQEKNDTAGVETGEKPNNSTLPADNSSEADQENEEQTSMTSNTDTQKKVVQDTGASSSGSRYYIIGSSFTSKTNATEYKDKLADEGFNPVILTKSDSSFYYVAYRGYNTLQETKTALTDIREYYNADAWIYSNR